MIISIATSKGGTGKTTFTLTLAGCLANDGKKVLVIDSDQQRSAHSLYMRENEGTTLFEVESLEARFLYDFLKINRNNYDVIFLDIPRLTDKDESATIQTLTLCNYVIMPVLSGQFDIVSSLQFLETVLKPIAAFKKENDIDFQYWGFLNRDSRISDNSKVIPYMKKAGLPMFDTTIGDLKVFRDVSVNYSILDTIEGQRRFQNFYNEFKTKTQP